MPDRSATYPYCLEESNRIGLSPYRYGGTGFKPVSAPCSLLSKTIVYLDFHQDRVRPVACSGIPPRTVPQLSWG
ncbi:DNA ligase [Klebsiella phage vB_KpnM_BIS47]|uniref:DNA ligase n=1 Tax=Klebsiella phage vB_KpnM_BIS47 TaxID=1907784 RepID=A0A1V0E6T2_9CAUD|nr:DNA ligase [Klebsiella phage vB_KpnM_BIS47]ARB12563.1 DNA ligase [Klebsiella phage vB_KpnM_BIS47]